MKLSLPREEEVGLRSTSGGRDQYNSARTGTSNNEVENKADGKFEKHNFMHISPY